MGRGTSPLTVIQHCREGKEANIEAVELDFCLGGGLAGKLVGDQGEIGLSPWVKQFELATAREQTLGHVVDRDVRGRRREHALPLPARPVQEVAAAAAAARAVGVGPGAAYMTPNLKILRHRHECIVLHTLGFLV